MGVWGLPPTFRAFRWVGGVIVPELGTLEA